MIEVKERPTQGQFVEVWEYNGIIWSETYRFDESGNLEVYDQELEGFRMSLGFVGAFDSIRYFIASPQQP